MPNNREPMSLKEAGATEPCLSHQQSGSGARLPAAVSVAAFIKQTAHGSTGDLDMADANLHRTYNQVATHFGAQDDEPRLSHSVDNQLQLAEHLCWMGIDVHQHDRNRGMLQPTGKRQDVPADTNRDQPFGRFERRGDGILRA